jgi:hypothetical protein
MPTSEHAISFGRFMRVLMTLLLCGPHQCRVTVSDGWLEVRMGVGGWAFAARVPRGSIVAVEPSDRSVMAWGAHGWRGRWLVNGSSRGLVQLTIDPPARARCIGFPIRLRQLTVSLVDRDSLLAALGS